MLLTLGQSGRSQRAEVLEVVSDHRAALRVRHRKDLAISTTDQIGALSDGYDVVTPLAELDGNLRRQLLVEERPHERSARSPLVAAARPRSYSASFSAIHSSISCW